MKQHRKVIHFEIFVISSLLFVIGSLLWFLSMLPFINNNSTKDIMLLISSITFIIGSCGFLIMPFIAGRSID